MGDVGVHGSDIHCEEIGRGKVGAVVEGVDYLEGVGSFFYVGRKATMGCKMESRNSEMCSVGQEQADTIGRPGGNGLCILGSI